jgi:2-oxoglutarate ferredoxin oxidoreductase subunit alpha
VKPALFGRVPREHALACEEVFGPVLSAIPFTDEVTEFIKKHDKTFVVEVNRDGQLNQLLTVAYPEMATKLISVAHSDGLSPTANWVKSSILAKEVN